MAAECGGRGVANAVLVFPVLAGKTESDIRSIAEAFKADPMGYWESRKQGGSTLERVYWQHTPMGDFVVAYVETTKPTISDALAAMGQDQSKMGIFFRDKIKEIHGIDITQPPAGPPPENIAEWSDPNATKRGKGFAFSAPLVADQVEYAKSFLADAFSRDAMTETRLAGGQTLEVATLHQTPMGPVLGVYLQGSDPVAYDIQHASSTHEFDVWFKDNLKKIFPPFIDFSQPVPGITEIFDSEAIAMVDVTGRMATAPTPA